MFIHHAPENDSSLTSWCDEAEDRLRCWIDAVKPRVDLLRKAVVVIESCQALLDRLA